MLTESISLVVIGFSFGLMHALDADHVMAVSALNNQKTGLKTTLGYCANWALGHSGVLIFSGLLLFGLGMNLPESLQYAAEVSVGVLLICIGVYSYWQFRKQRLRLVKHTHDEVTHVHWHIEGDVNAKGHGRASHQGGHAPAMVGVVHGLAGSAPALALVPAVSQGQFVVAMGYLAVFSIGVMLSMLAIGLGLGGLQQRLKEKHTRLFHLQRNIIAGLSIAVGSLWLYQAV